MLVRFVQIIAICLGIVHWACSKLLSTASTAAAFPRLPPTTATLLVQLPRSLHVLTVSDRPRCLSRSASGSIVRLCNRLFSTAPQLGPFSTAPQLVPFNKPLGGRRCGGRQAIRRGAVTQDVLTDCGRCAPMLLGHLTSQLLKTWQWRSAENAVLVSLIQATLVGQPLKGFKATTDPAGVHRNGRTVRPELGLAQRTA